MKIVVKVFAVLITLVLFLPACQDKSTSNENDYDTSTLTVNLEDLYNNNIEVDSLIITIRGDNTDYKFTSRDISYIMLLDINLDRETKNDLLIEASLYWDTFSKSAYSKFRFSNDKCAGYLKAIYYHQNVILKLDTNPAFNVTESDFYNFNALDHFFKEHKIVDPETKADAYINSPMKFMIDHPILYSILDENNIPFMPYDFGDYYNPVFTCNNAFGCYDEYLRSGDQMYLDWFYDNVDWLIDYKDSNSLLRYEFEFPHETITLNVGWTSAMAQGQALAALSMAYHVSEDEKYLQAAHEFFVTMYSNIGTDWNLYIDSEDYLWYEEYPSQDFCHVLNGKLFGMWGLWDYYCITRNEDALHLLQGGIASILDNYPLWDVDGVDGSHYCCHTGKVSTYHRIHKLQLEAYRDMFDIQEFDIIFDTFTNQRSN